MTYVEAEVLTTELTSALLGVCPIFGIPPTDLESVSVTVSGTTASIMFNAVDTVVNDQTLCTVAGVMLRRAEGRVPTSILDGDLVKIFKNEELEIYRTTAYEDTNLESGATYYYKFFPYSKFGVYNFHGNVASITVP